MKTTAIALAALLATPAWAGTVTLTPAEPQPTDVSPGLAVTYAYPKKVKTLAAATAALKEENAEVAVEEGDPLIGLSYLDTEPGEMVMTSKKEFKVAAAISGFIKFDEAGTFKVEVISNDGIDLSIGGQQVGLFDETHGCESAGVTTVEVPSPGWYVLEATYFQSKGTSCLLMDWDLGSGEMEPVPDEAFGH